MKTPCPDASFTSSSREKYSAVESSDKSMASTSDSVSRRIIKAKLDCSPDNSKGNVVLGLVAIFWDIENCPIPKDTTPKDIYRNVKAALGKHQVLSGDLTKFCAYGDFDLLPTRISEDLQTSAIEVVHVSRKQENDAVDKIMADVFFFALDNPGSSIVVFSGDVNFARSLNGLCQRGYTIAIAIPYIAQASLDLTRAAEIVWDWPSLARGKVAASPKCLVCPGDL